MSDGELSVYVPVARPDGSTERVRVGTAVRSGDGFLLKLGEVYIGGAVAPRASSAGSAGAPWPAPDAGSGPVFPNYGRSKNQAIFGATETDLEYYSNGCRRTLGDETKARWHDKERVLLAAIEAELTRQRGGEVGPRAPSGPPSSYPSRRDDGPPPPTDDDIPF